MNGKYYYDIVAKASQDISWHPGIQQIICLAKHTHSILDVGCGEGTKLKAISNKKNIGTGIDVNLYAIRKAKKQYPCFTFVHSNDEKFPFKTNTFGLVYSTFVLEHTHNQELFIEELIRVTKKNGHVVILCPNYGSPNRRSPVSNENPLFKLLKGFFSDLFPIGRGLGFNLVVPKKIFKNIDDDTTCEPYLHKLVRHFNRHKNIKITQHSSLWEIDNGAKSIHQKIFKFLGQKNIFPFNYWGPQIFIVVKKIS